MVFTSHYMVCALECPQPALGHVYSSDTTSCLTLAHCSPSHECSVTTVDSPVLHLWKSHETLPYCSHVIDSRVQLGQEIVKLL